MLVELTERWWWKLNGCLAFDDDVAKIYEQDVYIFRVEWDDCCTYLFNWKKWHE